jgi:hypothetical protein
MDTNLGLVLCAIILGFLFYYLYTTGAIIIPALQKPTSEDFEMPGRGADVILPIVNESPRTIMPSGPNPPSQAGQADEIVVHGEPMARDPYAEGTETANAPENMRQPERAYQPAPQNTDIMIAGAAGTASPIMTTTPGAIQAFNTDFIENRGEFMEGVFANDTTVGEMNFSAF